MNPPQRCYKLTVTVEGDSWEDVLREFRGLCRHVEAHGPECTQVSGGYSTSSTVSIEHDPNMTGDQYREIIDAYLASEEEDKGP